MNKQYKQDFIKAGALAGQVRAYGKSLIVPGASYNDVMGKIKDKIREVGAKPAFPPQIALNDVAAHFLPNPGQDITFTDQVVKLDIGVSYNGAIGDCAVTIDLSGKFGSLIEAAEAALLAAEKSIQVGLPIRNIGKTIEQTITSFGFKPVKNLSGHGLGQYQIHTEPHIPNYDDHSKGLIRPGMTFAIEPFATNGRGSIVEAGEATIFSFMRRKPITDDITRALIAKIKEFQGLPFAIHDMLDDTLTGEQVYRGLKELVKSGAINGYGPLVEQKGSRVAQAENSVLVDEDGKVFITTRI
ncbi:MAG: type II methionyl aminopeptidase [Verrucomicrobia bacterium]|nr:type II methionyl aminopeptidase [Verrucomicrobiota bacterium]MBS0636535.1 type II methionyl aminopeptidase [Verrucomicrobiota bacterium]